MGGKLWKSLKNEYNIKEVEVSWDNKPENIEECTVEQLSFILLHHLLISDKFKDKLYKFRDKIVEFMNIHKFDGSELFKISRKEFGQKLSAFLGDPATLSKAANIFTAMQKFDLCLIPELKLKSNEEKEINSTKIKEIIKYNGSLEKIEEDKP